MGGKLISRKKIENLFSILFSVLGTALISSPSFAVTAPSSPHTWIRYQDYKIHLDTPDGWKIERDLYGMPITVLGPMRSGERAVLNIQHSPIYGMEFDHELIKKTKAQYYHGRHEWVEHRDDTKYVSDLPYRHLRWTNGNDGFELGFRYQSRGLTFEEKSSQINCGKRLYFIKTLSSDRTSPADKAVLAKLVNEINCTSTTVADGPYQPSPLQDLARKFHDRSEPSPWPTRQQLKTASKESKVAVVAALIEFYKEFDEAGGQDSFAFAPVTKDTAFAKIKDPMDRFFAAFSGTAYAKGQYDCFFGGWPSKIKNGTCQYPWKANDDYAKVKDSCAEGQLACNPSLFGSDPKAICIDVSSAANRAHATLRCEAGFREEGRSFDKVVTEQNFDQGILDDTIESAKKVCSDDPYASANYGLCSTLKEKLSLSINVGKHEKSKDGSDDDFMNGLDKIKPENFDDAVKAFMANYKDFESRCIGDDKKLKTEVQGCIEDNNAILDDMQALEKAGVNLQKEFQQQQEEEHKGNNKQCIHCGENGVDPTATPAPVLAGATSTADAPVANSCSAEETKNAAHGVWDCTKKGVHSLVNDPLGTIASGFGSLFKCAGHFLASIVDSLWSTVKSLGQLVWSGVKWVGNKISQAWDWLTSTKEVEDTTASKAQLAAQTDNSMIEDFKKNPMAAGGKFLSAIYDGVKNYFKTDAFCQGWSGVPHFSTCTKPANFDCLSCDSWFQGSCSTVGYVVGELAPAILTGGGAAMLKGIGVTAKVSEALSKMGKLGKLMKLEKSFVIGGDVADVAAEGTKVVAKGVRKQMIQDMAEIQGSLGKSVGQFTKTEKFLGKMNNVVRWPIEKVNAIKKAFTSGMSGIKTFKSAKLGTFKETMSKLATNRSENCILQAGTWVAKDLAKGGTLVATGLTKVVKGAVSLVTFPIRAPAKLFVWAQRKSVNLGFKYGEKIFNKGLTEEASMLYKSERTAKKLEKFQNYVIAGQVGRTFYQQHGTYEKRNAVDWASDEDIEKMAKDQGKTPDQVRTELNITHAQTSLQSSINRAIESGIEPSPKDIQNFAKLTDQTVEQVTTNVVLPAKQQAIQASINTALQNGTPPNPEDIQTYAKMSGMTVDQAIDNAVVLGKLNAYDLGGGPPPTFTDSEIQAHAKVNNMTVDQAKAFLLDQVVTSKLEAIFKDGKEINVTDEEYQAYATMHGLSLDAGKKELSQKIVTNEYKYKNGIIDDSDLPPDGSTTNTQQKTQGDQNGK